MARKKPVSNTKRSKLLADQGVALAEYAAKALIAAEQLRNKTKAIKQFPLDEPYRSTVANLPALPAKLKKKLAKKGRYTVAETASMVMAVADSFLDAEPGQQVALLLIAKKLMECLHANIVTSETPAKVKKAKPTAVFQFKITLLEIKPPIWRRIQVQDCTLDEFHEHVQTSMGWTNSHLHKFKIGERKYADPMLMEEDFVEFGYKDSTRTNISKIIPKTGKRFSLFYEYDFGDSWEHEVLFEGCPKAEAGRQYPICLEGERACPPEDVGGTGGYDEFLEAIADSQHEEHEEFLRWAGGRFYPEEFDPATATKSMKKGLPDWRSMV
jgi:hypothetical protein